MLLVKEERSRVFQRVNVRMELERWAQFEVHGADQVVLGEKQQSLAVDLLGAELLGHTPPTCAHKTSGCIHLMRR